MASRASSSSRSTTSSTSSSAIRRPVSHRRRERLVPRVEAPPEHGPAGAGEVPLQPEAAPGRVRRRRAAPPERSGRLPGDRAGAQGGRQGRARLEQAAKVSLFRCKDCGDCSLPEIAYVCPESMCAKNQRNGPCGGTRDGLCGGLRHRVHLVAGLRAAEGIRRGGMLDGPVVKDNALAGTSAWANAFLGRDHAHHEPAESGERGSRNAPATAIRRRASAPARWSGAPSITTSTSLRISSPAASPTSSSRAAASRRGRRGSGSSPTTRRRPSARRSSQPLFPASSCWGRSRSTARSAGSTRSRSRSPRGRAPASCGSRPSPPSTSRARC